MLGAWWPSDSPFGHREEGCNNSRPTEIGARRKTKSISPRMSGGKSPKKTFRLDETKVLEINRCYQRALAIRNERRADQCNLTESVKFVFNPGYSMEAAVEGVLRWVQITCFYENRVAQKNHASLQIAFLLFPKTELMRLVLVDRIEIMLK